MEAVARDITLEDLLRHAGWVTRVARQLVGEDAEDLAQELWLKASVRPPRATGSTRAWLARVLRNRAHNRAREDQRRRGRDQSASGWLANPPTPEELTERMELHRLV